MRRTARFVGLGLAVAVTILSLAAVVTARSGDPSLWPPAPGSPTVDVFVVSHGYHAGIAISTARVAEVASQHGYAALIAITQRFAGYPFIEVGWGDEGFYSSVSDAGSLTIGLAMRALFQPGNASVLHVVGVSDTPRQTFPSADIVRVSVSEKAFVRMMRELDKSFARSAPSLLPQVLGKGLYGPSLFYRANGSFHIFNVCNHWVAHLLSVAGLPTAPVLAIVPAGLFFDLKWRSGIGLLPATGEARG